MKKMNKSVIVAFLVFLLGGSTVAKASNTETWRSQYAKILDNPSLISKYFDFKYVNFYYDNKFYFKSYFLCDIDNNKIPELLVRDQNDRLTAVLTCSKYGKIIGLGYNNFYKINKGNNSLIVRGHWHGAGGSGIHEYVVYKIDKNKMKMITYIDLHPNIVVYKNGEYVKTNIKEYRRYYSKYVDGGRLFNGYRFYGLKNKEGLYKIQ